MSTNGNEMAALGTMFVVITFGLQTAYGGCHIGLGMMTGDIRDYQITASSTYSTWTQPFAGRLWNDRRPKDGSFGGWCAMYGDENPYLQVEFKKHKVLTAVATQGLDFPSGNWVTKYAVNYSCDGKFWKTYQSHNNNTVLSGNSDGYSVQKNTLDNAIIGRVIRIRAVDWNPYGIVCIRTELYGCDVTPESGYEDCNVAAGMENREITNEQITASSFMHQHHPSQGRLHNVLQRVNGSAVWGSWCTNTVDTSQYIQVDLTVVRNVTGIATQGSQLGNWVTKYVVNYSVDGLQWQTFRNESGTVQVFQGNTDELTVKKNTFGRRLVARFVRINPRAWRTLGQICMRMEIYVCQLYQGCSKSAPLPSRTTTTSTLGTSHMDTTSFKVTTQTHRLQVTETAVTSMIPNTKSQDTAIESVVRKRYSEGETISTPHSVWLVLMILLCWLIQFGYW